MATTLSPAQRRNVQRFHMTNRQLRMRNLARKRGPLIATSVLRALQAAGLPADKTAYEKRLKELEA
jgi:hypothetical protein